MSRNVGENDRAAKESHESRGETETELMLLSQTLKNVGKKGPATSVTWKWFEFSKNEEEQIQCANYVVGW